MVINVGLLRSHSFYSLCHNSVRHQPSWSHSEDELLCQRGSAPSFSPELVEEIFLLEGVIKGWMYPLKRVQRILPVVLIVVFFFLFLSNPCFLSPGGKWIFLSHFSCFSSQMYLFPWVIVPCFQCCPRHRSISAEAISGISGGPAAEASPQKWDGHTAGETLLCFPLFCHPPPPSLRLKLYSQHSLAFWGK